MQATILLLEDDKILRDMYKLKLELSGYKVSAHTEAKSAFDWLKKHKADIAIVDIILPGINGLKFIKTIRQNTRYDAMRIIILTNLTHSDINLHNTVRESLDVSEYFVKSQTSPAKLIAAVKTLL